MSATINVQRKSFGTEFIKRTAGLISDASKDYISEVMPVSSSTLKEAKSTFTQVIVIILLALTKQNHLMSHIMVM